MRIAARKEKQLAMFSLRLRKAMRIIVIDSSNLLFFLTYSFSLENHHASSIFKLLRDRQYNIWSNMNSKEYRTFRALVVSFVLATDMANHASLVERISTYFFLKETNPTSNIADSKTFLQTILHAADISNATKAWPIYLQSAQRIMEEFFIQGDLEKIHYQDDKPTFDRETTNVVQLQIGFITHIVNPTVCSTRSFRLVIICFRF